MHDTSTMWTLGIGRFCHILEGLEVDGFLREFRDLTDSKVWGILEIEDVWGFQMWDGLEKKSSPF